MKFIKTTTAAILGVSALFSAASMAETHVVKAAGLAFKPLVVKVQPGDQVAWKGMTIHNVNTEFTSDDGVTEYIPEGAEGFTSKIGNNFTSDPLTVEGVYFYKCDPHWGAGMGGVVIVGEPTNLQKIVDADPSGALGRLVRKTQKAVK
ncbi:MAG: plastocyanin/azurin family copper-binding protein [Methylophaga sp.]|nr:plastocyanin/azurin family copper-binding protein [Methylophaga sp.]